jgi:pyruvate dehydrogenase E1 component alpha subunit/2-oxoisovalerate dehydrogenase E1 component
MAKTATTQKSAGGLGIDADVARALYRDMALIRRFEEKAAEAYALGKIGGFLHLYIGEEAVAVGATSALRPDDYAISAYREHGHCLAKGCDPRRAMAELFGRVDGLSKGKGGSMHLFDKQHNFLGGHAIVGSHLPVAAGVGFAIKYRGGDQVIVCYFGDGAVPEGEFHESMNLAALWQVPVIFLCENNLYAMGTTIRHEHAMRELSRKAAAYDVAAASADGMDVLAVEAAAAEALAYVRAGKGPFLLECLTYRFRGHSMFDAELYRAKTEVEEWKARDPIQRLTARMMDAGLLADDDLATVESAIEIEVNAAVEFAEAGTWEPAEDLNRFVYSETS